MENINLTLDEGYLAQVIDGCVKGVAFHLQISPQRVHQIVANDPFAGYMRIHRAMAANCPARAQMMADRFNATHAELRSLQPRTSVVSPAEALSAAESEGLDVLKAELARLPIAERKRETLEYIRALYDYFHSLELEELYAGIAAQERGGRSL